MNLSDCNYICMSICICVYLDLYLNLYKYMYIYLYFHLNSIMYLYKGWELIDISIEYPVRWRLLGI